MSKLVREIIELIRYEEYNWEALAEHFELCASCGGIPTGSYGKDTPFIECASDTCDEAFEKMCDDFIDETGNGNSDRNLQSQLYGLMKDSKTLVGFARFEADNLKTHGIDTKQMTTDELVWSRLEGFDRRMLNEYIVEYWKEMRENESK
mgnify:CR=1 FL=1|tara:strand:- start:152 stop:598 length:447 start_codon:yes stop_codon:yes gene_type:complete